jgi:hypothetical protein
VVAAKHAQLVVERLEASPHTGLHEVPVAMPLAVALATVGQGPRLR